MSCSFKKVLVGNRNSKLSKQFFQTGWNENYDNVCMLHAILMFLIACSIFINLFLSHDYHPKTSESDKENDRESTGMFLSPVAPACGLLLYMPASGFFYFFSFFFKLLQFCPKVLIYIIISHT